VGAKAEWLSYPTNPLFTGCASTDAYWGRPELSPATKADMSNIRQDEYACVKESRQQMGFNDFQSRVERDAQRLYVLCMRACGYEVELPR